MKKHLFRPTPKPLFQCHQTCFVRLFAPPLGKGKIKSLKMPNSIGVTARNILVTISLKGSAFKHSNVQCQMTPQFFNQYYLHHAIIDCGLYTKSSDAYGSPASTRMQPTCKGV